MQARQDDLLRHWPAMVRVCERQLGSRFDAEDCASAALVAVLAKGGLDGVENAEGWLVAIAKRRAADLVRTRQRERARMTRAAAVHAGPVEDVAERIVEQAEARWLADSAREVLSPGTQQVLQALMSGQSISDTAVALGITKRAAESHLHRARLALRGATSGAAGWIAAWLWRSRRVAPAPLAAAVAFSALVVLHTPAQQATSLPVVAGTPQTGLDAEVASVTPLANARLHRKLAGTSAATRRASGARLQPTQLARVGTKSASVVLTTRDRGGATDPVGTVLECAAGLVVSEQHVGC